MTVDHADVKTVAAAKRNVRRFLVRLGYKRGKKTSGYHLSMKNQVARKKYVSRMIKERLTKEKRIMYMDESYRHHNYSCHNDSLYDPNDPLDPNV
jgi:hypothetical protein